MGKKYMLHPGRIISRTDGQEHFVDAPTLAGLYDVKLHDCLIVPVSDALYPGHRERRDVIHLYPKSSGDYTVPNNQGEPGANSNHEQRRLPASARP